MNYVKKYKQLIEHYRFSIIQGYAEKHHILPKCMGGDDSTENLVLLPIKAHYVAHHLLWKIHPNNPKIAHAFWRMACGRPQQHRIFTARMYAVAKAASPGFALYNERKQKEGFTDKEIANKVKAGKANIGVKKSAAGRQAIKKAAQTRDASAPIISCPHCGHTQKYSANMRRYHFNNCRKFLS